MHIAFFGALLWYAVDITHNHIQLPRTGMEASYPQSQWTAEEEE